MISVISFSMPPLTVDYFQFKPQNSNHQTGIEGDVMPYIRQDKAGNDDSERIQSVLCEDTLRVTRIIVV